MSNDATLYEDHFELTQNLDSTYERVARVMGTSRGSDVSMTLDVNSELYPLHPGDQIQMLIATTLNLDGTKDAGGWREKFGEETLASAYDYVCYGKVYKHFDPGDGQNM
jgi:DNA-directed RNA polymerases I, II, and III subunit RPABC3